MNRLEKYEPILQALINGTIPLQSELMIATGYDKATLKRCMQELECFGMIEKSRFKDDKYIYYMNLEDGTRKVITNVYVHQAFTKALIEEKRKLLQLYSKINTKELNSRAMYHTFKRMAFYYKVKSVHRAEKYVVHFSVCKPEEINVNNIVF